MRKFREMIFSGGNKGFTLIELLVVIAVLGILAGIAVPRIMGVRDEAENAALRATANTFRNAMEMYYSLEGSYPDFTVGDGLALGDIDTEFGDLDITFSNDTNAKLTSYDNSTAGEYSATLTSSVNDSVTVDVTHNGVQ